MVGACESLVFGRCVFIVGDRLSDLVVLEADDDTVLVGMVVGAV